MFLYLVERDGCPAAGVYPTLEEAVSNCDPSYEFITKLEIGRKFDEFEEIELISMTKTYTLFEPKVY